MNERREPDDFLPIEGGGTTLYRPHLPLAMRMQPVNWPSVDAKTHPARHTRVPVQRRRGPRASRFNDLETTR